jgi:hypothetical protein
MTTKNYFWAIGVAGILSIALGSIQVFAVDNTTAPVINLVSQKKDESWQQSTWHRISWSGVGVASSTKVQIIMKGLETTNNKEIVVINSTFGKKSALVPQNKLNKLTLGKYRVVLKYNFGRGASNIKTEDSAGIVTITKAPNPLIAITAPLQGTSWTNGKQRITWLANVVRIQINDKNANAYAGIRVVPTYGIDISGKNLDLSRFSEADRKVIMNMKPKDLMAVIKLSDDMKEKISPGYNDPALKNSLGPAFDEIQKLTADGMEQLKNVDFIAKDEFTREGILKPYEDLRDYINTDPLAKTIKDNDPLFKMGLGDLFGDEDTEVPEKLPILIEAIPVTGTTVSGPILGVPIKLAKSYLEKGKHIVNLKKLKPGSYKIKITTKLPTKVVDKYLGGQQLTATSPVFNVTTKATSNLRSTSTRNLNR